MSGVAVNVDATSFQAQGLYSQANSIAAAQAGSQTVGVNADAAAYRYVYTDQNTGGGTYTIQLGCESFSLSSIPRHARILTATLKFASGTNNPVGDINVELVNPLTWDGSSVPVAADWDDLSALSSMQTLIVPNGQSWNSSNYVMNAAVLAKINQALRANEPFRILMANEYALSGGATGFSAPSAGYYTQLYTGDTITPMQLQMTYVLEDLQLGINV